MQQQRQQKKRSWIRQRGAAVLAFLDIPLWERGSDEGREEGESKGRRRTIKPLAKDDASHEGAAAIGSAAEAGGKPHAPQKVRQGSIREKREEGEEEKQKHPLSLTTLEAPLRAAIRRSRRVRNFGFVPIEFSGSGSP
ncbi:hypothetical protein cyc_08279 [Cyclospora cayetanensis]|uniref:Uncharacterized protein n=1 Tax=Cyclospora cayetanensis TaxID=88456 RepID=A0A1D3D6K3_9EIME|nr:hypothetical protein cyc_08279 [Cyclospora cayetanensis]